MLPQIPWTDLVPADLEIATRERDAAVDGNVTPLELDVISKLVKIHDPKVIFEIGTFDGRTTLNLAAHTGPDARVYTLDLPPAGMDKAGLPLDIHDRKYIDKPQSGARFHETEFERKIVQLYGDSATFDFRPFVVGVDFIFIDGSHSYHYVLNDSYQALKLARGKAVILWHDYVSQGHACWPGLVQALNELHEREPAFRGMKHIAGTAIAFLEVNKPSYRTWLTRITPTFLRHSHKPISARDSRQPESLIASLRVEMEQGSVQEGVPLAIKVTAKNVGSAVWLPATAPLGQVHLGCKLLDERGRQLNQDFYRSPFSSEAVLPGDNVEFAASVPSPPKGRYVLEFDFVAEGVAWFSCNGSETVRVPVEIS